MYYGYELYICIIYTLYQNTLKHISNHKVIEAYFSFTHFFNVKRYLYITIYYSLNTLCGIWWQKRGYDELSKAITFQLLVYLNCEIMAHFWEIKLHYEIYSQLWDIKLHLKIGTQLQEMMSQLWDFKSELLHIVTFWDIKAHF